MADSLKVCLESDYPAFDESLCKETSRVSRKPFSCFLDPGLCRRGEVITICFIDLLLAM